MTLRERMHDGPAGMYFRRRSRVRTFSSGCKLLDLALGGGWAERRVANVVGDKSSGKTLLMTEAACNFLLKYRKGKVRYRESEHAFDESYAELIGLPTSMVDFGDPLETVEDLFEDLSAVVRGAKVGRPELYIVDSLDALSDRAEMAREIDKGSYGASKAKQMSELLRRLTGRVEKSNVTVLIVSQVRDKIGVTFGERTTRSGGRALDFYASQIIKLSQLGVINKTVGGVKRAVGIDVRARVTKNKIGLPLREAQFPLLFAYGLDDVSACLDWAKAHGVLGKVLGDLKVHAFRNVADADAEARAHMHGIVESRWHEIDRGFLPTRRKYNLGSGR